MFLQVFAMKKDILNIETLCTSAKDFCKKYSAQEFPNLFGITDGKAIGTKVESLFKDYLQERFVLEIGSAAGGLDLPSVNTDIKVTSIKQPQSSCPYKDSKQKIYGLGYNLLVFVYEKNDDPAKQTGSLNFLSCSFIEAKRTADYQITTGLLNIIKNNGNQEDIVSFLWNHNIPADDVTLQNIAEDVLKNPPNVGYLTISNALQWRLQYGRVVNLQEKIDGITQIVKYKND